MKDYGALGDGSTDDTAALNTAIAALTNNSVLYFPPGQYQTTGLNTLTGLANVLIFFDGAILFQTVQANNTMIVDRTCSQITIRNAIFGGSASTRLNGIHLRFDASNSVLDTCEFYGASDFGCFIGQHTNATATANVRVINCYSHDSKGDGFHADNVDGLTFVGCRVTNSGDDAFGFIGYEAGGSATTARNISVYDCEVYNSGFRGIAGVYVDGLVVENFKVDTSVGSGIELTANSSHTSVFNDNVVIRNVTLKNCVTSPGPIGAVNLDFCNSVTLQNVSIVDPATGSCVSCYDWQSLKMSNLSVTVTRTGFSRGIFAYDQATLNGRTPRAAWGTIILQDYTFDLQQGTNNEAIYLAPAAGITIDTILITGATGSQVPAGNYIFYNRLATAGKIGNNTCIQTRTVAGGGTGATATTFNNN